MKLEDNIKDVITKSLENGMVEEQITKQLEKGISNALDNMFRSYGDVTKIIEKQIKSVIIPYLENYDYSEYITKLDDVLIDVLNNTTSPHNQLLDNFKSLMTPVNNDNLKLSDVFNKWMEYVGKNIDTNGLNVEIDSEPYYEYVDVNITVEYTDTSDWLKYEQALILMECDHDASMNIAIPIHRFTDMNDKWRIEYKTPKDLASLRQLNEFEIYLMRLNQIYSRIELDIENENAEVLPEEEPEATFY